MAMTSRSVPLAAVAAAFAVTIFVGCTVAIDLPDGTIPAEDTARPSDTLVDAGPPPADAARPDALDIFAPLRDAGPRDAGPRDTGPPPPRDVVFPADVPVPRDADAGAGDVPPVPDVLARPDLPTLRYCPWDLETVPVFTRSAIRRGEDFAGATSSPSPVDRSCDGGLFPARDREERVFAVLPDGPAELSVRAVCPGWDCDAILVNGDCVTANVAACGTQDGPLRLDHALLPSLWLLQIEARTGSSPAPFDLVLALDYAAGRDPCPVAGELRLSELPALSECALAEGGGGSRIVTFGGDTAAAGAVDDVFVDCRGPGIDPDSVGGAPDRIWRVVHDAPDRLARRIDLSVTTPDGSWEPVLAVTGSPCGAVDAVVDCDRGATGPATVRDVTIFAGESLYVVVDGVGELLLDDRASGPFTLTLTVSDPACGTP